MTLSTMVYVHDEANAHEVFHFCRGLLGATDAHRWTDEPSRTENGARLLSNDLGIGLPALLMSYYRVGASLRAEPVGHDEWCGEDCTYAHPPAAWLDVDFDTDYGYKGPNGEDCGVLHASVVARLGQWLDERGIGWSWRNEFTGDIHGGADRYARLMDLHGGGEDARSWFESAVLPAIRADFKR